MLDSSHEEAGHGKAFTMLGPAEATLRHAGCIRLCRLARPPVLACLQELPSQPEGPFSWHAAFSALDTRQHVACWVCSAGSSEVPAGVLNSVTGESSMNKCQSSRAHHVRQLP